MKLSDSKEPVFLMHSTLGLGDWYKNLPFTMVPRGFIEQIFGHPFTYEEYLEMCPSLNRLPNIWNLALLTHKLQVIAFQYGHWDPLANLMEVVRFTIHPKMFRVDGNFIRDCMIAGKLLAKQLEVKKLYWITCKWRSIERKLPNEVRVMDTRVMEVIWDENLYKGCDRSEDGPSDRAREL